MIPRYFKTADFVEPDAPLYYLVAAAGTFLVKKTPLFTAVTEAHPVAGLEPQKPSLSLHVGKVPRAIMERAYGFFDWAWRNWESEAIVFLYYSAGENKFLVDAPPQTIFRCRTMRGWRTEGRLEYGTLPRPEGYVKLGDAHSHADLPPFFSAMDDRDDSEEGLKIVMGNLDRERPDLRVSFMAGGTRFMLAAVSAVELPLVPSPPPRDWIRRFTCQHESDARAY